MSKEKLLKNKNIVNILELIRRYEGISRADIAKKLNLTPASISKLSKKLLDIDMIKEIGLADSTGGRPAKILKLNNEVGNIISLYLAPDYIELILFDLEMNKLYEDKIEFMMRTKGKLISIILKMIERALEISKVEVFGIGIAINGLVDSKNGISIYSPHYKWFNVNLVEIIQEEFEINTYIENDVRAMAIGEKNYGLAKDIDNFAVINIENGVGSGLYLNNQLYAGFQSGAGEFGHIPIAGNDQRCSCGKKGCLETLVTNESLEERYFNLTNKKLSAKDIYKAYNDGEEIASTLVSDLALNLAKGLVPLINILNPQLIILVGEINESKEQLYKLIKKELKKSTFGDLSKDLEIKPSTFSYESANRGAASLVMEKIFK